MSDSANDSGRLPAVLHCEPATGALRVAALTLLDRLLVTVYRAGCGPIRVVCAGELPELKRSRALGVAFELVRDTPPLNGPTLMATTGQLVQAGDVRAAKEARGRLVTIDGRPMPVGVTSRWAGSVIASLESAPTVPASGVAKIVSDLSEAGAAERALWASLNSSSDGFVDKWFNRPVGRPLSKLIIHTPITPNQVSVASIVIGVIAGVLFGFGQHFWSVVAG
jgi:hypothetical protein